MATVTWSEVNAEMSLIKSDPSTDYRDRFRLIKFGLDAPTINADVGMEDTPTSTSVSSLVANMLLASQLGDASMISAGPRSWMTMFWLIVKHKRMAFTKVSDLVTIGMVEAYSRNQLYYTASLQIKSVVRYKGGRQAVNSSHGVAFADVLIDRLEPRIYITDRTAIDKVWIVADDAHPYTPSFNFLPDVGSY